MKVITELMEAYAKYVELPILLVNSLGEVEFKVATDKYVFPNKTTFPEFEELKKYRLN